MEEKQRKIGIDVLGSASWGTHICHFYKDKHELTEIIVPFLKAGLEDNEFCVWVVPKEIGEKAAREALEEAIPGLQKYAEKGQLELVPQSEWYLKGGRFDPQKVTNVWFKKFCGALASGYEGSRIACGVSWKTKAEGKELIGYEEAVQTVIGNYQAMVLCSYSLRQRGVDQIMDVVSNHRFAVVKDETGWKLIKSFELEKAREELAEYAQELFRKGKQLETTADELAGANKTLSFERQQFLSILEGIDHPIHVTDPETYAVIYANRAALKDVGGDVVGKKCYQVFQGLESPCSFCTHKIILAKPGYTHVWEWQNLRNKRWHQCYDRAIKLPNGKWGCFEVAIDITERKQAEDKLKSSLQLVQKVLEGTVNAFSATAEERDPYTAGHQRRVSQLAGAIAREMGLSDEQVEGIRITGILHDIGKIYIPSEIISKPGRLSDIEYNIVRTHSEIGYKILKMVEFPWPVAQIVRQHHERIDGSGYPSALAATDILIEAKILAVADVVEAMTAHRPHRPALSLDKALQEVTEKRGTLYDPIVADVCIDLFMKKGFKFM